MKKKRPGRIVETKSGKRGTVYNDSKLINGKVPVVLDEGGNVLCDPNSLKLIGFVD